MVNGDRQRQSTTSAEDSLTRRVSKPATTIKIMATVKTTMRFLDADLVYDKVFIMVGSSIKQITGQQYRVLNQLSRDWTSGLEKKGNLFKFNSQSAYSQKGHAAAQLIKEIIK